MNLKFIQFRSILLLMVLLGMGIQSNAQTYCTPSYDYGCDDDYIQSFSTTGGTTNISNLNSGNSASTACLSNQTAMTHSTTAGATVNFTIVNNPGWGEGYKIYVDWNADGDFNDPDELVYNPTSVLAAGGTASGSFTVPASATAGSKRMRVRCSYSSTVFDACGLADYGEAEDYTLVVVPSTPCVNPPAGGTILASVPDSICPNIAFALGTTGTALGGGMVYQWEKSPTGAAGTWTDVAGATNPSYMLTSGIAATTFFRLKVICSGGTPAYSNTKQVLLRNFINCYCTPVYTYGCSNGGTIDGFATSGAQVDVTNLNTGCASGTGYSDYTAMSISAVQSLPFNFTVNITNYDAGVKIWADWNHDGTFDPVTELCAESANTITVGSSFTGIITPPVNAVPGPAKIRVRAVEGYTVFDPCASNYYGEAEDYTINVIALPPCTNPPTPGSVASSVPDSVCPNIAFTLNTTGTSYGSGMAYQWEQSPTGAAGTWVDVPGATTVLFPMTAGITTAAYYRLKTSCSGGTPVYSNAKHVTMKSFINCYCTPTYTYGCSGGGTIDGFATTNAMIDVSNLNTGCASGNLGYSDYSSMAVTAAHSFPFNFAVNISAYGSGVRIWADWNHDGIFDPVTELCAASANIIPNGSAFTGIITPPATAMTGPTRLRVRAVESYTVFGPCDNYYYGETEDYTIIIVNPPACGTLTLPTAINAVTSPNFLCLNGNSSLGINITMPPATGFTYQWQSATAAAGPWANIGTAGTTPALPVTGITATTYYRLQILCDGNVVRTTAVDSVVVGDPGSITATNGQRCGEGSVVIGATPASPSSQVLWYDAATGGNSIGSGASFNTPSLTATTTFYAAASAGTSVYTTGKPTPTSTSGNSSFNDIGLMFNALAPFTLESVTVYPKGTSPSGTITIALKNAAGTTIQSATAPVTVSVNGTTANTVPLNFSIPAGTGYRLVAVAASGITELIREYATGYTYPYTVGGVSTITSAYTGGASNDYYYYFYKWIVKTACESVRVPVVATVNPVPAPNLGLDINECVDQGTTVTLDPGTIPHNPVYTWDNGAATPTRQVGQSGVYHVMVSNSYGCVGKDTVEVRLKWNPVVDLAAGGTGLCLGGTLLLDAGPDGQNGGNYYWNNGAGTRTLAVANEGTYIVYVTSVEGCVTIDTVKVVATGFMPNVDGIVTLPTAVNTFSFSAVNPQNVTNFTWDFGDGSAPVTVPASTSSTGQTAHAFPGGGNYNVTLRTYSICGDIQDSTMVTIIGTGLNDVNEISKLVQVYPNPNDGTVAFITINDPSVKLQSLKIFNVMGQEVMMTPSLELHNGKYKVALPQHLAGGMYTLHIQTSKGQATKKLNIVK